LIASPPKDGYTKALFAAPGCHWEFGKFASRLGGSPARG
jgi:hypothetical protein